jgi:hypothetical protein
MGWKNKKQPTTPVTVLKRALELDKYVSTLDEHRMNRPGLLAYIHELLDDETITKLNAFNEPGLNNEIVLAVLHAGEPFGFEQAMELQGRLSTIKTDETITHQLQNYIDRKRKDKRLDRMRPWVILLIVLLLTVLMWVVSR